MTLCDTVRKIQGRLFRRGKMILDEKGLAFYSHLGREYARVNLTQDYLEGLRIGFVPFAGKLQKVQYYWNPEDLIKRVSHELYLGETAVLMFLHKTPQGREIFSRLGNPPAPKPSEIEPYLP